MKKSDKNGPKLVRVVNTGVEAHNVPMVGGNLRLAPLVATDVLASAWDFAMTSHEVRLAVERGVLVVVEG